MTTVKTVFIDEALSETKFGKFNYWLILLSGFISINSFLECIGINFALPVMDCDMDLSYQQKGLLGAVGFVGIIASSHLWGFLADTTGRRRIISRTLIAAYIVSAVSSFSPNFTTLVVFRFVNGFLLSGGTATMVAYLGEFHCNQMRNRAFMSAGVISGALSLLYPIVAWAVINQSWSFYIPLLDIIYKPWRLYIFLIGLLGLACGITFCFLPESPKYLLTNGQEKHAIEVLKRVYAINTGDNIDNYKITSIMLDAEEQKSITIKEEKSFSLKVIARSMWNQTVPLFMREHCKKTVLACVIQFWIFYTAQGLYIWFPFILDKVMQYTNKNPMGRLEICEVLYRVNAIENTFTNSTSSCHETLELSTYQHTLSLEAIFVALFLGVGYFTEKIGQVRTLFIMLLVCGSCGILSAFITIPIVAVYVLLVLLTCGIGLHVINAITVDMFPTHLRAMAICISTMIGRIGCVIGTNLIGALLENNCKTVLLTASIPLILGGFLTFWLPRNDKQKKENADV